MRSAIYSGCMVHVRRGEPEHRFTYDHHTLLIDLDELAQLDEGHRLLSIDRPNLMCFRRTDYFGDPRRPLADCIRDLVEVRLSLRPEGPIRQLAHLRTLGWLFNPIALYYCYERSGRTVVAVVAVVTNTPWKESHAYVMAGIGTHRFAKELHVSPFLGMQQTYEMTVTDPGEELIVRIASEEDGESVFFAQLHLRRQELTSHSLRWLVVKHPFATVAVSLRIHLQAARLWKAGAIFHRRPGSIPLVRSES
ncbi:MAG: DUF1365 domain-containing protein [Acidimicrobiales bacterium]